jgi:hypothetical protein
MSSTTRRGALLGTALAGLMGGAGVAKVARSSPLANPDAELIAACEEAIRQDSIKDAINRGEFGDDNEDAEDAARDAWWEAFERVEEIPATTKEGVRAKVRVLKLAVRDYVCSGVDWTIANHGEMHERMADALCNEILALGGPA